MGGLCPKKVKGPAGGLSRGESQKSDSHQRHQRSPFAQHGCTLPNSREGVESRAKSRLEVEYALCRIRPDQASSERPDLHPPSGQLDGRDLTTRPNRATMERQHQHDARPSAQHDRAGGNHLNGHLTTEGNRGILVEHNEDRTKLLDRKIQTFG